MLLEGTVFLIQNLDSFEKHVNELICFACKLSRQESNFLSTLIHLKAELLVRGCFVKSFECNLSFMNQKVKKLINEGMSLKESMATHVLILGAFIHEEMMICMHTSNCDMETLKLNERKKEISIHIQDNIIELLEKKRRYKTIKLETKEANRGVGTHGKN
jgi:hypothetical protein